MTIGSLSKKSRLRELLILALLEHAGLEKAAKCAGISPTTAWRIKKTTEFQEEYRRACEESYSQSIARGKHASADAVSIALEIMKDPNAPALCRLRAISIVLDLGAKVTELEGIEARLLQLEKAAEIENPGGNRP